MEKKLWTLANGLSATRILAGLIVAFALQQNQGWIMLIFLLVVVIAAELSDYFDGVLARSMHQVSEVGKILDPLADSLYRGTVFLVFLDLRWVELWVVVVVFMRDIFVSYLRIFSQQQGITMAARFSGKLKASTQTVAIISLLVAHLCGYAINDVSWINALVVDIFTDTTLALTLLNWIANATVFFAAAVTAYSAWDYFNAFYRSVVKA